MARTFVIGDIHGAFLALRQCLERSGFDYSSDYLISLGDVCDGWPETRQAIDELLCIKHLTYILGNHDHWARMWMESGWQESIWLSQGGQATIDSYPEGVPASHLTMMQNALYYVEREKSLFVHAGFDPRRPMDQQHPETLLWDRELAQQVIEASPGDSNKRLTSYDEVYIGHTPIPFRSPLHAGGVWMMDTGAGWSGVLSMMNLDTKEFFTSDPVPMLYPEFNVRRKKQNRM